MRRVMAVHCDADCFIHLGDGAPGFMSLCEGEGLFALAVKGNCDFYSQYELPSEIIHKFEDYRFFITHGNRYGVSFSKQSLEEAARLNRCDVALFGHTHVAYSEYITADGTSKKGLYLFNPGSLCIPRDGACSYGVIIIHSGQILFNSALLDDLNK